MQKRAMLVAALTLAAAAAGAQTFDGEKPPDADDLRHAVTVFAEGAAGMPSPGAVPATGKCPKGAKCGPNKRPAPLFQAVVHTGYAYVEMEPLVQTAITSHGGGPGTRVARINGVKVGQATGQIKMPNNVICVVSAAGHNTEAALTKDDIAAITMLGAVPDKNGDFPGRAFVKIELQNPVNQIEIETLIPKQATFKITSILYF